MAERRECKVCGRLVPLDRMISEFAGWTCLACKMDDVAEFLRDKVAVIMSDDVRWYNDLLGHVVQAAAILREEGE